METRYYFCTALTTTPSLCSSPHLSLHYTCVQSLLDQNQLLFDWIMRSISNSMAWILQPGKHLTENLLFFGIWLCLLLISYLFLSKYNTSIAVFLVHDVNTLSKQLYQTTCKIKTVPSIEKARNTNCHSTSMFHTATTIDHLLIYLYLPLPTTTPPTLMRSHPTNTTTLPIIIKQIQTQIIPPSLLLSSPFQRPHRRRS